MLARVVAAPVIAVGLLRFAPTSNILVTFPGTLSGMSNHTSDQSSTAPTQRSGTCKTFSLKSRG